MTDDRSLERAARSWIEVGPTAAPPHVVDAALGLIERTPQERDWFPWRLPRMSNSARLVALVAIGALILAGAFALVGVGGRGGPLPSTAPSASAVASAAASPSTLTLTETFVSPTYGYSIKIPAGWSTKPATKSWSTGDVNLWNSGFNDELSLVGAGMRFSGASQSLAEGQTADQWLTAYAGGSNRGAWLPISIGGQTGYLTANGVAAAGGTIAPGGVMFDAVVIDSDRAYNFNMDGKLDRATFDAIVATIALDPTSVGALPALDESFTSPWYGYSVKTPAGWSVQPATRLWSIGDRNGWNTGFNDELFLATAGQRFSVASQRLAEGQSPEDWLNSYAGGDTRTGWTSITIGGETGYIANNGLDAAGTIAPGIARAFAAVVISGDRAYNFLMDGNVDRATFDAFLATITLDPGSAKDS